MIEVKNLSKKYNAGKSNEVDALSDINFDINDGEFISIIGKSGSGKSTLLHIIALIDNFQDGDLIWDGESVKSFSNKKLAEYRNSKIGLVLQDFALIPEYTVLENVTLPLMFNKVRNKKKLALEALEKTGMKDYANKISSQLSGGQKQRVAISRAIVNSPSLLLADEPTGALDSVTSQEIMDQFRKINDNGTTVIIVTHDNEIAHSCKRIIRISDGKLYTEDK